MTAAFTIIPQQDEISLEISENGGVLLTQDNADGTFDTISIADRETALRLIRAISWALDFSSEEIGVSPQKAQEEAEARALMATAMAVAA